MALTVEEKVSKLHEFEHWLAFTEPQKKFLLAMAEGFKPTEAFMKAYPETKTNGVIFGTQQMMCRSGIKKALATIEIDTRKPKVSRDEAQELLSSKLRDRNIDAATLVKLLSVYAKIAGWDKEKQKDPDEEIDMGKLVNAIEKKRKHGSQ